MAAIGVLACAIVVPATARAEKRPRVPVAVFMVTAPGDDALSPSRHATLLLTMEKALHRDHRLQVIDKDRHLADVAGLVPNDVISEAHGLLVSGEALLRKHKPKLALARLQAAERQLERGLEWIKKRELARSQFLVGVAHAILGQKKQALAEFMRLQTWRPGFVADLSIEPRLVMPLWNQAKKKVTSASGGSIRITSSPDGALAYVDGRFVGFTPTSAEKLPSGDHYVTYRKLGYRRTVEVVEVSGQLERSVDTTLTETPGAAALAALAQRAAAALGDSRGPSSLDELATKIAANHIFFVRVPRAGDEHGVYEAFLYAADGSRLLARARAPASGDKGVDQLFGDLARAIYAQVQFERKPPPPPKKKSEKHGKPLYARWWFWTGISVLAAGAALPFLWPEKSQGPSCPPGDVCGAVILDF